MVRPVGSYRMKYHDARSTKH